MSVVLRPSDVSQPNLTIAGDFTTLSVAAVPHPPSTTVSTAPPPAASYPDGPLPNRPHFELKCKLPEPDDQPTFNTTMNDFETALNTHLQIDYNKAQFDTHTTITQLSEEKKLLITMIIIPNSNHCVIQCERTVDGQGKLIPTAALYEPLSSIGCTDIKMSRVRSSEELSLMQGLEEALAQKSIVINDLMRTVAEQSKKLSEQDKKLNEQEKAITEKNKKIAELEKKWSELEKKVAELARIK